MQSHNKAVPNGDVSMTATAINYENLTPILSNVLVEKKYADKGYLPKARKSKTSEGDFDTRVTFSGFSKDVSQLSNVRRTLGAALKKLGITKYHIDILKGSLGGVSVDVLALMLRINPDPAAPSEPAAIPVAAKTSTAAAAASAQPAGTQEATFDVSISGTFSKTFKATAGTTLKKLLKDEKDVDLSKTSFQDSNGRVVSADRVLSSGLSVTASRRSSGG